MAGMARPRRPGHTPRASLRLLAPLSLGRKGRIRLFLSKSSPRRLGSLAIVFLYLFVVGSQRRRRRQTVGPPGSVWKICPRHRSVVTLASAVASPARRGG